MHLGLNSLKIIPVKLSIQWLLIVMELIYESLRDSSDNDKEEKEDIWRSLV